MPFRDFASVLAWLGRATDYERMTGGRYSSRAYNLRRMNRLLDALGRPERRFRSVHIAGTKGKGSTAHMVESVVRAHGARTGLYTSPHLVHLLERIRIDGAPVGEGPFVAAMNRMRGALDRVRPTFFETMTACAFEIFARERVDLAVVEVGLGGRLDATNAIVPVACGITRIDYDHTDKLGTTLGRIAGEKGGILKPGVPGFTSERRPAAWRALRRCAAEAGTALSNVRVNLASIREGPPLRFRWRGWPLEVPLRGAFQAENAAVALRLAEAALGRLDRAAAGRGLAGVRIPGRLQTVRTDPEWIVDVAHNPFAARAAAEALPRRRTICIFGASRDKDAAAMIRALAPAVDFWIFTRADHPRAADPAGLVARGPAVRSGTVEGAVRLAEDAARKGDRVLVTGSFYIAGEALRALDQSSGRARSARR